MSRITAVERVQRTLSILPWIVEHQGCTVSELCERFDVTRTELITDLNLVFCEVGLHPFTPDMLSEVTIEDDRVNVLLGDYFHRPLRLTHPEALMLLAGGRALAERSDSTSDGVRSSLETAVQKLATALGDDAGGSLDVELGLADPETLSQLRDAVSARRSVQIEYYSYGRDERTERLVDPYLVVSRDSNWYLHAWCHSAQQDRVFRVDRITAAEVTNAEFVPGDIEGAGKWDLSDRQRTVEIIGPAIAAWVAETYPCDEQEQLDQGRVRFVLAVTTNRFLERLLLRLGDDVSVVDLDSGQDLRDIRVEAAKRILKRYESDNRETTS